MTPGSRAIIMSGESVRAILAGRKTVTRRIMREPWKIRLPKSVHGDLPIGENIVAPAGIYEAYHNRHGAVSVQTSSGEKLGIKPSEFEWITPHGQPGDRLWVRETWAIETATDSTAVMLHYAATPVPKAAGPWTFPPQPIKLIRPAQSALGDGDSAWRSPIYMPRWASRLTLEVVAVRVERLNQIDYRDVLREGIGDVYKAPEQLLPAFAHHWDRINAKRGYPWASNPWVFVISFRPVQL